MGACSSRSLSEDVQPCGPLQVGQPFPMTKLASVNRGIVDTDDIVHRHAKYLVVVFYRGSWCPFCNRHLRKLQKALGALQARNALLVAVSPESKTHARNLVTKNDFSFAIATDPGLRLARECGIAYKASPAMCMTHDLKSHNSFDEGGRHVEAEPWLPIPATFIVEAQTGIVRYAHIDQAWMINRMSPDDIVKQLDEIRDRPTPPTPAPRAPRASRNNHKAHKRNGQHNSYAVDGGSGAKTTLIGNKHNASPPQDDIASPTKKQEKDGTPAYLDMPVFVDHDPAQSVPLVTFGQQWGSQG